MEGYKSTTLIENTDSSGETISLEFDSTGMTADEMVDRFARFMLAVGYAENSVKDSFQGLL